MSFCDDCDCGDPESRPLLEVSEADATKQPPQPEEIGYFSNEVGPSIPTLWATNVAMLVHVSLFFLITLHFRRCHGDAAYPSLPLWAWLAAGWLLPLRLVAERQAMSCALPPYARDMTNYESYETAMKMHAFECISFPVHASFWVWYCMIFTALDFADVMTDVAYAGSMSFGGADLCSQGTTTAMWTYWWDHSILRFLPCISLDKLSLLAWLLSLFQAVIPLATMLRKESKKPVTYQRGDDGEAQSCLTGDDLFNDDVFFTLGEAAGLETVKQMSFKFKVCHIERLANWRMMGYAVPLSKQHAERFFLSYLLENGIQLNLQSWVLVITNYQVPSMPLMPILSLSLSFFMAIMKLLEVRKFISVWRRVEQIAQEALVPEEKRSKFLSKLSSFRRGGVIVVSAGVLLVLALCGACVTLTGMQRCPSGIPSWNGCLDIPSNLEDT